MADCEATVVQSAPIYLSRHTGANPKARVLRVTHRGINYDITMRQSDTMAHVRRAISVITGIPPANQNLQPSDIISNAMEAIAEVPEIKTPTPQLSDVIKRDSNVTNGLSPLVGAEKADSDITKPSSKRDSQESQILSEVFSEEDIWDLYTSSEDSDFEEPCALTTSSCRFLPPEDAISYIASSIVRDLTGEVPGPRGTGSTGSASPRSSPEVENAAILRSLTGILDGVSSPHPRIGLEKSPSSASICSRASSASGRREQLLQTVSALIRHFDRRRGNNNAPTQPQRFTLRKVLDSTQIRECQTQTSTPEFTARTPSCDVTNQVDDSIDDTKSPKEVLESLKSNDYFHDFENNNNNNSPSLTSQTDMSKCVVTSVDVIASDEDTTGSDDVTTYDVTASSKLPAKDNAADTGFESSGDETSESEESSEEEEAIIAPSVVKEDPQELLEEEACSEVNPPLYDVPTKFDPNCLKEMLSLDLNALIESNLRKAAAVQRNFQQQPQPTAQAQLQPQNPATFDPRPQTTAKYEQPQNAENYEQLPQTSTQDKPHPMNRKVSFRDQQHDVKPASSKSNSEKSSPTGSDVIMALSDDVIRSRPLSTKPALDEQAVERILSSQYQVPRHEPAVDDVVITSRPRCAPQPSGREYGEVPPSFRPIEPAQNMHHLGEYPHGFVPMNNEPVMGHLGEFPQPIYSVPPRFVPPAQPRGQMFPQMAHFTPRLPHGFPPMAPRPQYAQGPPPNMMMPRHRAPFGLPPRMPSHENPYMFHQPQYQPMYPPRPMGIPRYPKHDPQSVHRTMDDLESDYNELTIDRSRDAREFYDRERYYDDYESDEDSYSSDEYYGDYDRRFSRTGSRSRRPPKRESFREQPRRYEHENPYDRGESRYEPSHESYVHRPPSRTGSRYESAHESISHRPPSRTGSRRELLDDDEEEEKYASFHRGERSYSDAPSLRHNGYQSAAPEFSNPRDRVRPGAPLATGFYPDRPRQGNYPTGLPQRNQDERSYGQFLAKFARELRNPQLCHRDHKFRCDVMKEVQRLAPIMPWRALVSFYETATSKYDVILRSRNSASAKEAQVERLLKMMLNDVLPIDQRSESLASSSPRIKCESDVAQMLYDGDVEFDYVTCNALLCKSWNERGVCPHRPDCPYLHYCISCAMREDKTSLHPSLECPY